MLRNYLKLNFTFDTNTKEYKGRCVLVYLKESWKSASPKGRKVFLIKTVKVSKSAGDNHAEELFQ